MSTAATPSTSAWCILASSAHALAAGDALDDRQLPQRARAVQAPRELVADELGQLVRAAGRRQRGAAHVPAEVELVVVDPDRVGHPARGDCRRWR